MAKQRKLEVFVVRYSITLEVLIQSNPSANIRPLLKFKAVICTMNQGQWLDKMEVIQDLQAVTGLSDYIDDEILTEIRDKPTASVAEECDDETYNYIMGCKRDTNGDTELRGPDLPSISHWLKEVRHIKGNSSDTIPDEKSVLENSNNVMELTKISTIAPAVQPSSKLDPTIQEFVPRAARIAEKFVHRDARMAEKSELSDARKVEKSEFRDARMAEKSELRDARKAEKSEFRGARIAEKSELRDARKAEKSEFRDATIAEKSVLRDARMAEKSVQCDIVPEKETGIAISENLENVSNQIEISKISSNLGKSINVTTKTDDNQCAYQKYLSEVTALKDKINELIPNGDSFQNKTERNIALGKLTRLLAKAPQQPLQKPVKLLTPKHFETPINILTKQNTEDNVNAIQDNYKEPEMSIATATSLKAIPPDADPLRIDESVKKVNSWLEQDNSLESFEPIQDNSLESFEPIVHLLPPTYKKREKSSKNKEDLSKMKDCTSIQTENSNRSSPSVKTAEPSQKDSSEKAKPNVHYLPPMYKRKEKLKDNKDSSTSTSDNRSTTSSPSIKKFVPSPRAEELAQKLQRESEAKKVMSSPSIWDNLEKKLKEKDELLKRKKQEHSSNI